MARRLGWSPEAIEDIEAIASYTGRDSLWYAKAVATKIVSDHIGKHGEAMAKWTTKPSRAWR
jgi:plasmid stabilization system protein ParE